jgi:hypothetical protein
MRQPSSWGKEPGYLVDSRLSVERGTSSAMPEFICFFLAQQETCLDLNREADCQRPWPVS